MALPVGEAGCEGLMLSRKRQKATKACQDAVRIRCCMGLNVRTVYSGVRTDGKQGGRLEGLKVELDGDPGGVGRGYGVGLSVHVVYLDAGEEVDGIEDGEDGDEYSNGYGLAYG